MSDAVRTGAPRQQGTTRPKATRVLDRWPVLVWATAAVPLAVSVEPAPLEAKAPGVSHCYRRVCHHVKTVEQTHRMIGRTFVVETSYYDLPGLDRYNTGTYTSNGERFDANDPGRVASADLPDGTELLLRNPVNGRVSHVRVNDFGPFRGNRRLDVTRRVAEDLDFRHKGVVRLDVIVIAAPEEEDLKYRRNRERRATRGHLGVVFEVEMPGLVSSLVAERNPAAEAPAVVASIEPPRAEPAEMAQESRAEQPADRAPDRSGEPRVERVAYSDAPEPPIEQASEALPSDETEAAIVHVADSAAAAKVVDTVEVAEVVGAEIDAAQPALREPVHPAPTPAEHHPEVVASLDQPESPLAHAPGIEAEPVADDPVLPASPSGMQVAGFITNADAASDTGDKARANTANRNLILVLFAGLLSALIAAAAAQHRGFARRALPGLPDNQRSIRQSNRMVRSPVEASQQAAVAARTPTPSIGAVVPVNASNPQPATAASARAASLIASHLEIEGTLRSSGRIEISGKVKGRIEADEVVVMSGGCIEGDTICRVINVAGSLTGTVSAHQVLVLATGRVDATIETALITVDPAGRLEGEIRHRTTAPK